MKKIKLSNGVEIPQLGYGVYQVEPDECERCVLDALSVGYRMIDTAQAYLNEEAVGNAWKKSGVNRDDPRFQGLAFKLWRGTDHEEHRRESAQTADRLHRPDAPPPALLRPLRCLSRLGESLQGRKQLCIRFSYRIILYRKIFKLLSVNHYTQKGRESHSRFKRNINSDFTTKPCAFLPKT